MALSPCFFWNDLEWFLFYLEADLDWNSQKRELISLMPISSLFLVREDLAPICLATACRALPV